LRKERGGVRLQTPMPKRGDRPITPNHHWQSPWAGFNPVVVFSVPNCVFCHQGFSEGCDIPPTGPSGTGGGGDGATQLPAGIQPAAFSRHPGTPNRPQSKGGVLHGLDRGEGEDRQQPSPLPRAGPLAGGGGVL